MSSKCSLRHTNQTKAKTTKASLRVGNVNALGTKGEASVRLGFVRERSKEIKKGEKEI